MEYVRFGNTGTKVSRLCLGTMTFGTPGWRDYVMERKPSRPIVQAALDAGINFFDTADIYSLGGSEEVVGKLLKEMVRRDEFVLATKVYNPMGDGPNQRGLSRKHIMEAIDASLSRLGMDYVDLYIIHRWDPETPIEETMEALHDVVRLGKALHIGASSMFTWQFMKAQSVAEKNGWTQFVSMQNHYNLVYREEEREMLPLCVDQGIAVTPWSPLARGFLVGNRHRQGGGDTVRARTDDIAQKMYYSDTDFEIADRTVALAERLKTSPAEVALAWMLSKPAITAPIIGVSTKEQLQVLLKAPERTLAPEDIAHLEEPYRPREIAGHS